MRYLLFIALCLAVGSGCSDNDQETLELSWARAKPGTTTDPSTRLPREIIANTTGIEMVLIPAGEFMMGASPGDSEAYDDEKPRHKVRITKPFYLGKYEVTNKQFRLFQRDHDSTNYQGQSLNGEDQPVVSVSWNDAKEFCDRFGFRLPTEAEWEYAARAGSTTRYPWGDSADGGLGVGNVLGPSTHREFNISVESFGFEDGFDVTSPVGRFQASAFGLHDMIGNVWEWCADWYLLGEYARRSGAASDPQGPLAGNTRVMRGGAWNSIPMICRVSFRTNNYPTAVNNNFGLRVARTP